MIKGEGDGISLTLFFLYMDIAIGAHRWLAFRVDAFRGHIFNLLVAKTVLLRGFQIVLFPLESPLCTPISYSRLSYKINKNRKQVKLPVELKSTKTII